MKRIYKIVEADEGYITYYGSDKWIGLRYAMPHWGDEVEAYFMYDGSRFYLSEFIRYGKKQEVLVIGKKKQDNNFIEIGILIAMGKLT